MDFRGKKELSRGIRNNNPGNIVKTSTAWRGKIAHNISTDKRFEQFESVVFGIRAMMINIISQMQKGYNTIENLIYKWAPSFENKTEAYVKSVEQYAGVNRSHPIKKLDENLLIKIAQAIAIHENGKDAYKIPQNAYLEAYMLLDRPTSINIKPIAFSEVKKADSSFTKSIKK